MAREIVIRAVVLKREPRGERFIGYRLLGQEIGHFLALQRLSSKAGRLDLFDEGEFRIEAKSSESHGFLKEVQIERSRKALARDWTALRSASQFSLTLLANTIFEENAPSIFALLARALDGWEGKKAPTSNLFKATYLLCRDEGYPVKEQWARSLPQSDRATVAKILRTALNELEAEEPVAERYLASLQAYIDRDTHMRSGRA